jgi:hypothetical protein
VKTGKYLRLAALAVVAGGTVVCALAQDSFPDVPSNHWAYAALDRMRREGLLIGYPEGLFRGSRPASRYEMAVALHEAYVKLIAALDAIHLPTAQSPADVKDLKDQVATLQSQIAALKGYKDDIEALDRASDTFEIELERLGVNVEAMKRDMGDLAARVKALEKRQPPVAIAGDIDFWAGTGNSDGGRPALTQDGQVVGRSGTASVGLLKDLAVLHEGAFTFSGTKETGPQWHVTAVIGNMLGPGGFGNQSNLPASSTSGYAFSEEKEALYIEDADVSFDTSLAGLAFNADVGRVAYRQSPYMFQRIDNTPYLNNPRWDDGKYRLDGAILGFNFGNSKLRIVGGNNSNLLSTNGVDLDPTVISNNRVAGGLSESLYGTGHGYSGTGAVPSSPNIVGQVDRTLGADADIPLGKNGRLTLAYLWFEQDASYTGFGSTAPTDYLEGAKANRDNVFGADVELGLGHFKLFGGVHESDLYENDSKVNTRDNQSWDASTVYEISRWRFWAGYRQMDNNYYAPGDWGSLAMLYNPANIKGWQVGSYYNLTSRLRVTAHAEWDKGNHSEPNSSIFTASPFDGSTKINSYTLRLDWTAAPKLTVYGSVEDTKFDDPVMSFFSGNGTSTGNPQYDWATLGFGYTLGTGARLGVQYQFANVGNDIFLPTFGGSNRYIGGFLSTELSIKF